MVATVGIRGVQGPILSAAKSTAAQMRLPQGPVLSAINFPTAQLRADQGPVLTALNRSNPMRVDQGPVLTALNRSNPMRVDQGPVLAAVRGRVNNFYARAWTFTMDGHDFYVLQLGDNGTLVYDKLTQQWMTYESTTRDIVNWRANTGQNWNAQSNAFFNSDVVAGDDTTGMLWYLDPEQSWDGDGVNTDNTVRLPFNRVLTGGVPARGRGATPCNFVFLTGSFGDPFPESGIRLETSDDLGKTWTDNGFITINPGDWAQDVTWYSLGTFSTPGRIFRITDGGAFERIDSLDMS